MSRISTAICARFAASATRLYSLRYDMVSCAVRPALSRFGRYSQLVDLLACGWGRWGCAVWAAAMFSGCNEPKKWPCWTGDEGGMGTPVCDWDCCTAPGIAKADGVARVERLLELCEAELTCEPPATGKDGRCCLEPVASMVLKV